ncbi:MAG: hypothetical protein J2P37_31290 [Ktedonobacteraceae bacterium]|nr:hypothetical protein [Ktedonobacteraceae bacterium]
MTKRIRSYDIRVKRQGSCLPDEPLHGWGSDGEPPPEWTRIQREPDVEWAQLYHASQRSKRADKRKILQTYTRQ